MNEYKIERCKGNAGREETLSTEIVEAENIEQAIRDSMHGEDWPISVRDENYASAGNPENSDRYYCDCYMAERLVPEDCACPECEQREANLVRVENGKPVSCVCCGWKA